MAQKIGKVPESADHESHLGNHFKNEVNGLGEVEGIHSLEVDS